MRTTQLKILGEKKEAILVAGGSGFKIYSVSSFDGWVIKIARQIVLISKSSKEFSIVSKYVNLNYQPFSQQAEIKSTFINFIATHTDQPKSSDINIEPSL